MGGKVLTNGLRATLENEPGFDNTHLKWPDLRCTSSRFFFVRGCMHLKYIKNIHSFTKICTWPILANGPMGLGGPFVWFGVAYSSRCCSLRTTCLVDILQNSATAAVKVAGSCAALLIQIIPASNSALSMLRCCWQTLTAQLLWSLLQKVFLFIQSRAGC